MGMRTAASPGTLLELTDVVVHDTQRRESDGMLGRGLDVAPMKAVGSWRRSYRLT